MTRLGGRSLTVAYITLALSAILASPGLAQQSSASADIVRPDDAWDGVKRLLPGTSVRVLRRLGRTDEGRITAVSDDRLMLANRHSEILRGDILRV